MATKRAAPRVPPVKRRAAPTGPPEYPEHIGFILAEEEALKAMLVATLKLPDGRGAETAVPVRFRFPDQATEIMYPMCTIELIGIEPAFDLHQSEYILLPDTEVVENSDGAHPVGHRLYDPSVSPTIDYGDPAKYWHRRNYLPYRLFYQLGFYSMDGIQDKLMMSRLYRNIFVPRPLWLHVPADMVWRRVEVLGWTPADQPIQEGGSKRIFRKFLTLSIQTDMPQDHLDNLALVPRIQKVLLRMTDQDGNVMTSGTDGFDQLYPT